MVNNAQMSDCVECIMDKKIKIIMYNTPMWLNSF